MKIKNQKSKIRIRFRGIAALSICVGIAVYLFYDDIFVSNFATPLIPEVAAQYGIDPCLLAAVIEVESAGQPDVVSRSGAVGLMQIMPDTAKWLAQTRGWNHDESRLSDPGYNLHLGSYYLAMLLERHCGDVALALAAYNAGPGNVDKWMNAHPGTNSLELINTYAFTETREYVGKVLRIRDYFRARQSDVGWSLPLIRRLT
ncbi:MAG: lytic transglycosylase domain-containing protein [Planctomycetes bacterium]|nr:lytic transglycosylase domain-containing protein [Planctomycetota bacterium]MCR4318235.1 lytic transglycosylase domain-containing protein [Planctomycetota bacterium]